MPPDGCVEVGPDRQAGVDIGDQGIDLNLSPPPILVGRSVEGFPGRDLEQIVTHQQDIDRPGIIPGDRRASLWNDSPDLRIPSCIDPDVIPWRRPSVPAR
jgi:hypothetical protein